MVSSKTRPVRTRSQPFGVVHSTPETQARLQHENRSLDFIYRVAEQTLRCEVIRVPLVLILPEDFGGDKETGPSSLWCMQELLKPGVVLASCASSPGSIKGDRSDLQQLAITAAGPTVGGQCFHRTMSL